LLDSEGPSSRWSRLTAVRAQTPDPTQPASPFRLASAARSLPESGSESVAGIEDWEEENKPPKNELEDDDDGDDDSAVELDEDEEEEEEAATASLRTCVAAAACRRSVS